MRLAVWQCFYKEKKIRTDDDKVDDISHSRKILTIKARDKSADEIYTAA